MLKDRKQNSNIITLITGTKSVNKEAQHQKIGIKMSEKYVLVKRKSKESWLIKQNGI